MIRQDSLNDISPSMALEGLRFIKSEELNRGPLSAERRFHLLCAHSDWERDLIRSFVERLEGDEQC